MSADNNVARITFDEAGSSLEAERWADSTQRVRLRATSTRASCAYGARAGNLANQALCKLRDEIAEEGRAEGLRRQINQLVSPTS
jgi:hypothetical protein